ncbi:hypothetical protein [Microlunatus soli]|uniref:Uncharacterized protein n=1 Tax=Microlunatus soli TaxID=630515 RepID=A0A1H1Z3T9_9ACTN|nr:hypothetical protein [Microlunatus soli]SDT28320.1 hypothetical protein SAMN04489812_4963 [Microlunatus soli]
MRTPTRGRTVAVLVIAALVIPAIGWLILGLPPLQAMLIGALGAGVAALIRFPPDGYDASFPEPPAPIRDRGARREAFRLSWNVAGREDRVGSTLIARLQEIAARRLIDHGLRLDDPSDRDRVIALVGQQPYKILTLAPGGEATTRAFEHALAAVEGLGSTGTAVQLSSQRGGADDRRPNQ